jgi:hypothetical protein
MVSQNRQMIKKSLFQLMKSECNVLVKHNKTTQGLISAGQCARDVNIFTIEGQPTTLFSQIVDGQPLILLAGSTS